MVHGLRIAAPLRLDRRADSSLMHHPFDAKPAELGGTTDVRHFCWGLAGDLPPGTSSFTMWLLLE